MYDTNHLRDCVILRDDCYLFNARDENRGDASVACVTRCDVWHMICGLKNHPPSYAMFSCSYVRPYLLFLYLIFLGWVMAVGYLSGGGGRMVSSNNTEKLSPLI
jgi:hypothetical protein